MIPFKVSTRTTVTGVTVSNPSDFSVAFNGGGQGGTSVTFPYGGTESAVIEVGVTSATVGTSGQVYQATANAKIYFTGSEL